MPARILFIIPSLTFGGAEFQTKLQIEGLIASGFDVSLVVLSGEPCEELYPRGLDRSKLFLCSAKGSSLTSAALRETVAVIVKLLRFLREERVDILVAILPLAHYYGRLLKLLFWRKIKLLCYHHSLQYSENPVDTIWKSAFHRVQKVLSRVCDRSNICVSATVAGHLRKHLGLKNPVILHNGIQDRYREIHKDPPTPKSLSLQLLFPGRLNSAKGHLFFLGALREAMDSCGDLFHLTISGGGSLESDILSAVTELNLQAAVTMAGTLSNVDLLSLMDRTDLVVIPSIYEGLPLVAIEAAMMGRPVLCSDAGGLPEVVQHGVTGWIFPVLDHAACVEQLVAFADGRLPKLDVEQIRARFSSDFAFEVHFRQFKSHLDCLYQSAKLS